VLGFRGPYSADLDRLKRGDPFRRGNSWQQPANSRSHQCQLRRFEHDADGEFRISWRHPERELEQCPGSSSSSGLSVVSAQGQATSASVTWTSYNPWNLPITDVAGNNRMMRGYLDNGNGNPSTITFSGIIPGAYNIYVYTDGDNAGITRNGIYQISGSGVTATSVSATDPANTNFSGTFVQAKNSNGNYVLFSGATISSGLKLTTTPGATTDVPRAPVNAIQIIPAMPVSLNVNFAGSNTTLMANTETAGVIPETNWNNASGASSSSALSLVSGQGLATGASVTWKSDNTWNLPITGVAGNNRMKS
jgi:hypothetical protein